MGARLLSVVERSSLSRRLAGQPCPSFLRLLTSAPDSHNRSMSAGSNASAAFGLLPFPLLFKYFLAALSASLDDVNC